MDQLQKLREAIAKGASTEELTSLFNEVNWDEIPDDEQTVFFQESAGNDQVQSAFMASAIETGRVKTGTAPIIGPAGAAGPGSFGAAGGAMTPGVRSIAGEVAEEAARTTIKNPNLAKSVLSWIANHKKTTAAGVVLGGTFAGASAIPEIQAAGEPGSPGGPIPTGGAPGVDPTGEAVPPSVGGARPSGRVGMAGGRPPAAVSIAQANKVEPGYNVLVVDRDGSLTGIPGSVAVIQPEDMGGGLGVSPTLLNDISQSVTFGAQPNIGGQPLEGNDLISAGLARGGGVGLTLDNRIQQIIQPRSMGQVTINAPIQTFVDPDRQLVGSTGRKGGRGTQGAYGPATMADDLGREIPAGSSLAPRIFGEYRGRSLLEWASIAASRYGVPLNVLYGIIDHESNWNPNAVGDNGDSFGLGQINMPAWGSQISPNQAKDPVFALNWTAQMLSQRFKQYGRWDAAIAAHNHPEAADHLAKTNRFMTEKSANYVGDIMGKANTSGLDNTTFAADELLGIEIEGSGGGGGGTTYTPYQSPDPAANREFIEATYMELLGRKPDENEFQKELARIESLSRSQYEANLAQAKGRGSQGVDVEAQFREGIKDTGEFAFNESTHELNSFTDFTAGVARLLQQGL